MRMLISKQKRFEHEVFKTSLYSLYRDTTSQKEMSLDSICSLTASTSSNFCYSVITRTNCYNQDIGVNGFIHKDLDNLQDTIFCDID